VTKLVKIIRELITRKFTGELRISFHQGTMVILRKLEKYGDIKE